MLPHSDDIWARLAVTLIQLPCGGAPSSIGPMMTPASDWGAVPESTPGLTASPESTSPESAGPPLDTASSVPPPSSGCVAGVDEELHPIRAVRARYELTANPW